MDFLGALPGKGAILAAVAPAPGDSLYFVAKGDGSHQFSATLDEHRRAVEAARSRLRQRSGRAPFILQNHSHIRSEWSPYGARKY